MRNGLVCLAELGNLYQQEPEDHELVNGLTVCCYGGVSEGVSDPLLKVYSSMSAAVVLPINSVVFAGVMNNLQNLSQYFAILAVDYLNDNAMTARDPIWNGYVSTFNQKELRRFLRSNTKTFSVDDVRAKCEALDADCCDTFERFKNLWIKYSGSPHQSLVKANHLVFFRLGVEIMDGEAKSDGAIKDTGGFLIPVDTDCDRSSTVVECPNSGIKGKKVMKRSNDSEN